jgi:hypothetical protein
MDMEEMMRVDNTPTVRGSRRSMPLRAQAARAAGLPATRSTRPCGRLPERDPHAPVR